MERTWNKPNIALLIPEAMAPQINGYFIFKLTPKIAGSVIPSIAENADEPANDFCFLFFEVNHTAAVAAP